MCLQFLKFCSTARATIAHTAYPKDSLCTRLDGRCLPLHDIGMASLEQEDSKGHTYATALSVEFSIFSNSLAF